MGGQSPLFRGEEDFGRLRKKVWKRGLERDLLELIFLLP